MKALRLAIVLLSVSACQTVPGTLETPSGTVSGDLFGDLRVLGVSDRITGTGNRTDGKDYFSDVLTISVPVGTEVIVPAIRSWYLGYGHQTPALPPNAPQTLSVDDHHYALGDVTVQVLDLDAPNLSVNPPTQTARLGVRLVLRDDNGDDDWFGEVSYTLIYLGRPRPGTVLVP